MAEGKGTTNNYGTRTISIVEQARSTTTKDFELYKVIQWIRTGAGRFAKNISAVREATEGGDLDRASELKRNLPAVMFSGKFAKRSSKDITEHSGLICMDVDKIEAPSSKVDEMRFDPHIVAAFVSPSANGLKAIFAIPKSVERHAEAFESAKRYLATYGLNADESGKDVSRLCFLSHDSEIHYAPDAVELPVYVAEHSTQVYEKKTPQGGRIGDRYEESPNIRERSVAILQRLGWQIQRGDGDRTYCTRPGKSRGVSGELRSDGSFFCYTDGASPLEPLRNYSAFALYTIAEHRGDFKEAAKSLAEEFGEKNNPIDGRDYYNKNDSKEEEQQAKPTKREEIVGNLSLWTGGDEYPEDLKKKIIMRYPVLIDGLLHRGTKMVLGGGSKSYKTWTLLNLAASVASGTPWFGHDTVDTGLDVIYLNFEVPHLFFLDRSEQVCKAMGLDGVPKNLKVWSLRGQTNDLSIVLDAMKERMNNGCALLVVDPIYKALGDRDENSAGDIGLLMNEVEAIVEQTGASVAFGAHYSKGNQAEKDPLDRVSGSGVFARDPDTIMGLTAHEEDNCYTVHSALRNFPGKEPFVVEWDFPLFSPRKDLDAGKLKRPGQKITAGRILSEIKSVGGQGVDPSDFVPSMASKFDVTNRTIHRMLKTLSDSKKIHKTAGNYFLTN